MYEESYKVELKREMVDDLDKEIIAFLNTRGGTIYIGVTDDGKAIGVPQSLKDFYDEKVSAILTNNIKPNCRNKVQFLYNEENVLEIHIKEGDSKPYYLTSKGPKSSGTYIRVGRSKRPATDDEILNLVRDYSGYLWEKEISPIQNLHFKYLKIFFEAKDIDFNESKYLTLGLIDSQNNFTNLGMLFSDENPIEIKFAKYNSELDFVFKKVYTGPLCLVADSVLRQADEFNIVSAKILPYQAARKEKISYPGKSLREAILNAFCHADYDFPSNIKIEFFENYCRISNPGAIYKYSLDEVLNGQQSFRNPGVVRILYMLGFIENFGSGLHRIIEAYSKFNLNPIFNNMSNSFAVILSNLNPSEPNMNPNEPNNGINEPNMNPNEPNNGINEPNMNPNESNVNSNENNNIFNENDVLDNEEKVLNLINNGCSTNKELIDKLQLSKTTIFRITQRLQNTGRIIRVGSNRYGHWEIVKK